MSFHASNVGLEIQHIVGKGRGIMAKQPIPAQTLVEVSPVLLFSPEEYKNYAKHTILDSYTFTWPTRDGSMALALGIGKFSDSNPYHLQLSSGSLFNHSVDPNTSFSIDKDNLAIRFTTSRAIQPEEELCIFYSHNLWFEDQSPKGFIDTKEGTRTSCSKEEDPFLQLSIIEPQDDSEEILDEESLPFEKLRYLDSEEEMEVDATMDAWVVDIPDPKYTAKLMDYVKSIGLDTPDLSHLKRVRRPRPGMDDPAPRSSLLLSTTKPSLLSPPCELPEPYLTQVPVSAARTLEQVAIKSNIWPTIYQIVRRELRRWSRREVKWIEKGMRKVYEEGKRSGVIGELPIASFVYGDEFSDKGCLSSDTRKSEKHPLRHSIVNLVREAPRAFANPQPTSQVKNGQHYLLTSRTLFTTHEPCIMCSMALLHSRVKDVFYLYPMSKTGGCGGSTCVPGLRGVNHRFGVWKWKTPKTLGTPLQVEDTLDA